MEDAPPTFAEIRAAAVPVIAQALDAGGGYVPDGNDVQALARMLGMTTHECVRSLGHTDRPDFLVPIDGTEHRCAECGWPLVLSHLLVHDPDTGAVRHGRGTCPPGEDRSDLSRMQYRIPGPPDEVSFGLADVAAAKTATRARHGQHPPPEGDQLAAVITATPLDESGAATGDRAVISGRKVSGPVAWLGVLTADGRHITRVTMERTVGLPIMLYDDRPAPSGALPVVVSYVVGVVHSVSVDAAGVVALEGVVNEAVDPGRYGVGVDLARTDARPWGDGEHVDISGQLVGVTMYLPGSDTAPAFPDAHLIVEAP